MVEEAVDENRVERPERGKVRCFEVGLNELPAVFRPCDLEVVLVDIQAHVFGTHKATGIRPGTAADVENAPYLRTREMTLHWRELLGDKRSLPRGINGGMFQDTIDNTSYRHLISNGPNRSP